MTISLYPYLDRSMACDTVAVRCLLRSPATLGKITVTLSCADCAPWNYDASTGLDILLLGPLIHRPGLYSISARYADHLDAVTVATLEVTESDLAPIAYAAD